LQRPWVFVASLLTLVLIAAATRNSAVLLAPLVLVQVLLVVRATRALGTGNLTGWVVYLGAVIASLVFIILGISYLPADIFSCQLNSGFSKHIRVAICGNQCCILINNLPQMAGHPPCTTCEFENVMCMQCINACSKVQGIRLK